MSPAAKYAAAEQARLARDPRDFLAPVALPKPPRPEPRGNWSVVRKFDDGKTEPIRMNMTEADASKLAGELRDRMTDEDCAKGFQIVAIARSTGFVFPNGKDRAVARVVNKFRGRPTMSPEEAAKARSEHARKAARRSWANR